MSTIAVWEERDWLAIHYGTFRKQRQKQLRDVPKKEAVRDGQKMEEKVLTITNNSYQRPYLQ